MSTIWHGIERIAARSIISHLYNDLADPSERANALIKMADRVPKFYKGFPAEKVESIKAGICDPENRYAKLLNTILDEADPGYAKKLIMAIGFEAAFCGTKTIRKNREKYGCNIPWLILFDPTMACNMHCIGCWSGTYGHKASLTYEEMDRIVTQGKDLGIHFYMLTGGEPLMRKDDLLTLCRKHSDCMFAAFTNSTLITDDFCQKVVELGNLTFLLSIEGTPETNDARRGDGHYEAVMRAMDLLKAHGIIFGTSVCYTRDNIEAVTSDEFLNLIASKGAHFGFYFHYMPVGSNAVPELLPTKEQRLAMIDRIRYIRSSECDIPFYPMDFQNDGEFVGGCIAGGRNYFHINSNGDAEPCVFIHFSDSNIREKSVLEILQSPLFKEYHKGQPFNRNHLRPCPMLENPDLLREVIERTGAHQTNMESPETVEHLCAKCDAYAEAWAPAAEEYWQTHEHKKRGYENYSQEKREHPDLAAFEEAQNSEQ
ncbi:MAG: radical SAM protein [Oscillospiraceae bacterium]|nr:radical SAM protein [Oscillospiraceae bacterium]